MVDHLKKVFLLLICIASSSVLPGQENDVIPQPFQENFNRSITFYRSILQNHDSSLVIDTVFCNFDMYFNEDTIGEIEINDFNDLEKYIKIFDGWDLEWILTANNMKWIDIDTTGGIYSCSCYAYDSAGDRILSLSPLRGGLPKPQNERREGLYYSYDYVLDFHEKGYLFLDPLGSRSQTLNQIWDAVWSPTLGLRWFKNKNMKVDTLYTTQEAMRYKTGQYKFILSERSVDEE